eukprot:6194090-Pleurochrysis_carterae.AAC.2
MSLPQAEGAQPELTDDQFWKRGVGWAKREGFATNGALAAGGLASGGLAARRLATGGFAGGGFSEPGGGAAGGGVGGRLGTDIGVVLSIAALLGGVSKLSWAPTNGEFKREARGDGGTETPMSLQEPSADSSSEMSQLELDTLSASSSEDDSLPTYIL